MVTVAVATLVVAYATALGAELSRWTVAVVLGLVLLGFVAGLLPRLGPRAATMQLPLLIAFAYSAAFPLEGASVGSRMAAVLAATPVYILGAAVLFQTDARRPLRLGAAAGLGGVADALEHAGEPGATRHAELGLVKFRVATGRLKDAALPTGNSLDARAGRLLAMSVQQAVGAAELVAGDTDQAGERREQALALGREAKGLAGALTRAAPIPAQRPWTNSRSRERPTAPKSPRWRRPSPTPREQSPSSAANRTSSEKIRSPACQPDRLGFAVCSRSRTRRFAGPCGWRRRPAPPR